MSKYSKRHFTVVIKNKENGLYISSTPSSAAKKAVSKLCASNKNKKVEFHIREITRDSKKKTYGPYIGYLEKLKIPIKLKEYIIKYNPVAKLKKKTTVKKIGMRGGNNEISFTHQGIIEIEGEIPFSYFSLTSRMNDTMKKQDYDTNKNISIYKFYFDKKKIIDDSSLQIILEERRKILIKQLQESTADKKIKIHISIPYIVKKDGLDSTSTHEIEYKRIKYLEYEPHVSGDMLKYLNIALQKIGIDKGLMLFDEFLENFDKTLPIISVGSGHAYFEFLINERYKRKITCVDPDQTLKKPLKNNNANTVFIRPEFNSVDELMSSNHRNFYNNCLLILNWPEPSHDITYDFDAIIKLKPNGFFIIYEENGISGSTKMIGALNSTNIKFNEELLSYKVLKKESYEWSSGHALSPTFYFVVAFYIRN